MNRQTKTFAALVALHCLGDCYGGVWPMFKFVHGVDIEYAGVVAAVSIMVGQGLQPVFGLWSDHGYQRRLILLGTSLTCLSMLLGPLGLAEQRLGKPLAYACMFAIMLLVRTGQGMFHPAGTSVAGNWSHARRSTAIAAFITAGMMGMGCSQGFFSQARALTGGHTEWMLIPAAFVMLSAVFWCRPATDHQSRKIELRAAIANLAPVRGRLALIYVYQALNAAVANVLIFLMPEFMTLRQCPHWMVHGGGLLIWISGSVLLMIPAGHLADRFGRVLTLRAATAIALAFYAALALDLPSLVLESTSLATPGLRLGCFIALLLLTGGTIGLTNPIGVSLGQNLAPQNASIISGILMGLAWAFGSVAMWVAGRMVRQGTSIESILTGMIAACVLALALTMLLRDSETARRET